jgi:hypothetical protein
MDGRMSFSSQFKANISKLSRMPVITKRISRKFHDTYTHKILYTSLLRPNVKPNVKHASGRLFSQFILSGWNKCNTISFVMRALFARDILLARVNCADFALMLRFEEVLYSRRCNAELLKFFH